ncbi:MAG TPA: energy-coupling factor transporter ATPase [Candidatus Borkfalkia stercoripullorum]|nr:energy-coupling factor transporter ATPase [Candidatus Borkfalkia stercoripullorum]
MRIIAKGLTYTYNPKSPFASQALKGVDIVIEEGEFFGIIGHTGSGKSTFVQHLNALIKLTGGFLKVGEYDLSEKKCNFLELRSKVGMVFQYPEYQLFAETVEKDVMFGLKNFRKDMSEEDKRKAVREALETVGLGYEDVKDRSPFELSGGQKRRAAIAGVIVTKPEVLILDEPAAGLDPLGKREIMELLHAIHGGWCKTIVVVSHDMDEIAENCTRAAVFSDGKVVMEGTPAEIFRRSDELIGLGLDIPVTAKCARILKERGIEIDTDFTCDDFISKVLELYARSGGGVSKTGETFAAKADGPASDGEGGAEDAQ